jgi:hypothetical protein
VSAAATSSDLERLIGNADVDVALAAGDVHREMVQGRWLFFPPDGTLDEALDDAAIALANALEPWLVNPGHFVITAALRHPRAQSLGKPALTLLARELCARGRLLGLPLLNQQWQPYLAFFTLEDAGEVERQVGAVRELLDRSGRVSWRELPNPQRPVTRKAWRVTIVGHGEWLGLGWCPDQGELEAW